MFLTDRDILELLRTGSLKIEPFNESALTAVGYRLAFRDEWLFHKWEGRQDTIDLTSAPSKELKLQHGAYLELPPGAQATVLTAENFTFAEDIFGIMLPLSRLSLHGILSNTGLVSPGWSGTLLCTLGNTGSSSVRLGPYDTYISILAIGKLVSPPLRTQYARTAHVQDIQTRGESLLEKYSEQQRQIQTRVVNRAVLMTDQVESTSTMERHLAAGAAATLLQRKIILEAAQHYRGEGHHTGGDATVSIFEDVCSALRAAQAAVDSLNAHNRNLPPSDQIMARFGIHFGPLLADEMLGPALNVAARVRDLASGGQIFVSDEARVRAEEIGCPFHFHFIALAEVEGMSQPIPIFEAKPKRLS